MPDFRSRGRVSRWSSAASGAFVGHLKGMTAALILWPVGMLTPSPSLAVDSLNIGSGITQFDPSIYNSTLNGGNACSPSLNAQLINQAVNFTLGTMGAIGGAVKSDALKQLGNIGNSTDSKGACPSIEGKEPRLSEGGSCSALPSKLAELKQGIPDYAYAVACQKALMTRSQLELQCVQAMASQMGSTLQQADLQLRQLMDGAKGQLGQINQAQGVRRSQLEQLAQKIGMPDKDGKPTGGMMAAKNLIMGQLSDPGKGIEAVMEDVKNRQQVLNQFKEAVDTLPQLRVAAEANRCFSELKGYAATAREVVGQKQSGAVPGGAAAAGGSQSFRDYIASMYGNAVQLELQGGVRQGVRQGNASTMGAGTLQQGDRTAGSVANALNSMIAQMADQEYYGTFLQYAQSTGNAKGPGDTVPPPAKGLRGVKSFADFKAAAESLKQFPQKIELKGYGKVTLYDAVVSKMGNCWKAAERSVQKGDDTKATLMALQGKVAAKNNELQKVVSTVVQGYKDQFALVTDTLSGTPIKLLPASFPANGCNASQTAQLECLNRAKTSLRNILEGPARLQQTFAGKQVAGPAGTRPIIVAPLGLDCDGLNACISQAQNLLKEKGQQMLEVDQQKQLEVNNLNSAIQSKVGQLKNVASSMQDQIEKRLSNLQGALGPYRMKGFSSLRRVEGKELTPNKDFNGLLEFGQGGSLYNVVGQSMEPKPLDLNADPFSGGMSEINQRNADLEARSVRVKGLETAMKEEEARCKKEALKSGAMDLLADTQADIESWRAMRCEARVACKKGGEDDVAVADDVRDILRNIRGLGIDASKIGAVNTSAKAMCNRARYERHTAAVEEKKLAAEVRNECDQALSQLTQIAAGYSDPKPESSGNYSREAALSCYRTVSRFAGKNWNFEGMPAKLQHILDKAPAISAGGENKADSLTYKNNFERHCPSSRSEIQSWAEVLKFGACSKVADQKPADRDGLGEGEADVEDCTAIASRLSTKVGEAVELKEKAARASSVQK